MIRLPAVRDGAKLTTNRASPAIVSTVRTRHGASPQATWRSTSATSPKMSKATTVIVPEIDENARRAQNVGTIRHRHGDQQPQVAHEPLGHGVVPDQRPYGERDAENERAGQQPAYDLRVVGSDGPGDVKPRGLRNPEASSTVRYQYLIAGRKLISNTLTVSDTNLPTPPVR